MVAFSVKDWGGMIPRTDPHNLPNDMAAEAWNCDLASGPLDGLPIPELLYDFGAAGFTSTVAKAYRIPNPTPGGADVWLPLPSPYSSVCKSPLANDTLNRFYWTNPGDGAYWNTYDRIAAGNTGSNAPYNLGFTAPGAITPTLSVSGGTTNGSVPLIDRTYLFTYIDQYGAESSPSLPSAVVAGASDGTWTVGGLPTSAPASPSGKNYPTVSKMRLYRTITGTTTGAQYYQVADLTFGSATYADTIPDTTVVNNVTLPSASWAPPLDGLDGLVALPGGMLVGFTGNTVHFCEPDLPHTWPAGYDQSMQYDIVGLAVWNQALVVITEGFPSTGSGNAPANYVFAPVQVPEPWIARGSIITDLMGVYYASQNGIVMLNYFGMLNQTLSNMTKNIWLNDYKAANIIACRHRAQYLAINGSGVGFLIDYADAKLGVMHLDTFSNADCIWNDPYTGDAYICANKQIFRWDSPNTDSLIYRWKSKQFYLPKPTNLGACMIVSDPAIETPPGLPSLPNLFDATQGLILPPGVNAVFNLYAGSDAKLIYSKLLTKAREIFRLPAGFKAFLWQFEIVGQVPVHELRLATTIEELDNAQ